MVGIHIYIYICPIDSHRCDLCHSVADGKKGKPSVFPAKKFSMHGTDWFLKVKLIPAVVKSAPSGGPLETSISENRFPADFFSSLQISVSMTNQALDMWTAVDHRDWIPSKRMNQLDDII